MTTMLLQQSTNQTAPCTQCGTLLVLTVHQQRSRTGKVFCPQRCRDRYHHARYRERHPERRDYRHTGPRDRTPPAIAAVDQDYLGGGMAVEHLLPPYPPYRCTCEAGGRACDGCKAWRQAQRDAGKPVYGPALRSRIREHIASALPAPPDWQTAPYADVYAYWSTTGKVPGRCKQAPRCWTSDGLVACGLSFRRTYGRMPTSRDCRDPGSVLPSPKAIYRVFGSLIPWQRAIEHTYAREVTYAALDD